ncbi:hypothetical protein EVAR_98932_1 [Eumeta japonica]|uniref:Uncharacterized protein n=1 Tax=Eumeta variegata TaxID=151549 RepID=A0A4C2A455_EUMVA|nr:hypothetical protein EVAR_98932_1 [Eumeta japonica]
MSQTVLANDVMRRFSALQPFLLLPAFLFYAIATLTDIITNFRAAEFRALFCMRYVHTCKLLSSEDVNRFSLRGNHIEIVVIIAPRLQLMFQIDVHAPSQPCGQFNLVKSVRTEECGPKALNAVPGLLMIVVAMTLTTSRTEGLIGCRKHGASGSI